MSDKIRETLVNMSNKLFEFLNAECDVLREAGFDESKPQHTVMMEGKVNYKDKVGFVHLGDVINTLYDNIFALEDLGRKAVILDWKKKRVRFTSDTKDPEK
jgi:hypothetical protein